MVHQILSISSLLLGSAFLLFAGGINGLILPIRGAAEGFSALSLGLLGTGWAVGYVSGCLLTTGLVNKVGHIRAFSVMSALAALAVLASSLLIIPVAWILLRAMSGFCFAGAAMIVESWLGEKAEPNTRGQIFGFYTMVNLLASTGGQMLLTVGESESNMFFVLAAMFYCLALIPTSISSTTSPKPLVSVNLDLKTLWRNSPIAIVAVFLIGIANSSFGTMAAVYGSSLGLDQAAIALFCSLPILAGAISQAPVGILSDRLDRRKVLISITMIAACADLTFILVQPTGMMPNLIIVMWLGSTMFAKYPIIVAHANDNALPDSYIQTSGGLLLIFGIGSILGPAIVGFGMSMAGPSALFMTMLAAHLIIIAYTIQRVMTIKAMDASEKVQCSISPMPRTSTPETAALAMQDTETT